MSQKNVIEIRGIDFINKGAELMLAAIQQELATWNPRPASVAQLRVGSFADRSHRGLGHLLRVDLNAKRVRLFNPLIGPLSAILGNTLPTSLINAKQLFRERDVLAIFDASGFSYGDQLGAWNCELMAFLSARWKRQGKKIILLPQALGPFNNYAVKASFRKVLQNADLVYARDQVSLTNVLNAYGPQPNLRQSPDITIAVDSLPQSEPGTLSNAVAVIPSQRMLDRTDVMVQQRYLDTLIAVVNYLGQRGLKCKIVVHETKDLPLARELQQRTRNIGELVTVDDALVLKHVLGRVDVVVSSRFHGLVSALSQGVPVIAMGWSHKYRELLEDFGVAEYLLEVTAPIDTILERIDRLMEPRRRLKLRQVLFQRAQEQKTRVRQMWHEVRSLLSS